MGKLFNLKEWLTLSAAAKHLSNLFQEEVSEADILRLGLDGKLTLSVNFVNHAHGLCGKIISWEETDWEIASSKRDLLSQNDGELPKIIDKTCPPKLQALIQDIPENERKMAVVFTNNYQISDNEYLRLSDDIKTLHGIFDLPMIGGERHNIENLFQEMSGGPSVTLFSWGGVLVKNEDGELCQVQDRFNSEKPMQDRLNYFPAATLPSDAMIVIRTKALRAFEDSQVSNPKTARHANYSELLAVLHQASFHFWENFNPADPSTETKNEIVAEWLMNRGFSKSLADSGASIIRPKNRRKGGRPPN